MRRFWATRRKTKVLCIIVCSLALGIALFSIEVLSYITNSKKWKHLSDSKDAIRILFVADPQLQGEVHESPIFGDLTRWDSDR